MTFKRRAATLSVVALATVTTVSSAAVSSAAEVPVDPAARAAAQQYVDIYADQNQPVNQAFLRLASATWGRALMDVAQLWVTTSSTEIEFWLRSHLTPGHSAPRRYAEPAPASIVPQIDAMHCDEARCMATISNAADDDESATTTITLEKTLFGWKVTDMGLW